MIGGDNSEGLTKRMFSLTVSAATGVAIGGWKELPPMPIPRNSASACTVGDKIFVFGGFNDSSYLSSCDVYDCKKCAWMSPGTVPPMRIARASMAVAVIEDRIFLFGGFSNRTWRSRAEVYDTKTNSWTELPLMPTQRSAACAAVVDERFIWVIGGSSKGKSLNVIEAFDSRNNEWLIPKVELPFECSEARAAVVVDYSPLARMKKSLVVIGGSIQGSPSGSVMQLDLESFEWKSINSMIHNRRAFDAVGF